MNFSGKRGQVTAFIIIGIVIVIVLALFFVGRQTVFLPTTNENLNQELGDIEQHIFDCLEKDAKPNTNEILTEIGLQGGYLDPVPDSYFTYQDSRVSVLCYNIEDNPLCRNRALTLELMEEQISRAVEESLNGCLDLEGFEQFKPVQVSAGELDARTTIEDQSVVIELDYPVVVTGGDNRVSRNTFTKSFDVPLGDLYGVSQDIIDDETTFGTFDTLSYMNVRRGEYRIYLEQPYPHKLYTLKRENDDYLFQFVVEGEPR